MTSVLAGWCVGPHVIAMLGLSVAGLVAGAGMASSIELGELQRDGAWVFTERSEGRDGPRKYMAATPAAESGDVWLLLACDAARMTASVMFSTAPEYTVRSPAQLVLQSGGFPVVSVAAQVVHRTQISIDAETTRHLMPLFFDSASIVVSVRDAIGAAHAYTFSLQSGGRALAPIERVCAH